jgi:hypothetical protein
MPGEAVLSMMRKSLFALHVRGDDSGSSRVYESVASGTLQLFLANRFYNDSATFVCAVPWKDMVYALDEAEFLRAPAATVEAALSELLGARDTGEGRVDGMLQRMWRTQVAARRDLLWHVPGSRVGHNILEEASRILLGRGLLKNS